MKLLPMTLKGWADYMAYAAGIVIGFGLLGPLMDTVEDQLRKGE